MKQQDSDKWTRKKKLLISSFLWYFDILWLYFFTLGVAVHIGTYYGPWFFSLKKKSTFFFWRILRLGRLVGLVRGRRQAHNPTLAKILRLTYNRSCSHNRPQTAACNAVYSISRRALLITRLGEQLPRPRQVSMLKTALWAEFIRVVWSRCLWASHKF